MTSSTSPLLATLLLSHPLFSIPPGQTLSITLFSSILSLPLLFPRSVSSRFSPALRHRLAPRSPDMTSGTGRPGCEMSKIPQLSILFFLLLSLSLSFKNSNFSTCTSFFFSKMRGSTHDYFHHSRFFQNCRPHCS